MIYRLALIEDDYDIRQSVRSAFNGSTKVELELETDAVEKTLLYYRNRPAPHLILLDLSLPGLSGLDGLPLLRRHLPETAIVIHTILEDEDKVFQAICNGASGYLLKNIPYENLEQYLLITLESGGSLISPAIARRILDYFSNGKRRILNQEEESLGDMEHTIVNLLVDALSYQQIADKLGMSINGVRYYVKRIYAKLQVKSRNQLVRHMLRNSNLNP